MAYATTLTPKGATLQRMAAVPGSERLHRTVTLAELVEAVASESGDATELVTVVAHMLRTGRVTWCGTRERSREGGIA